MKIIIKVLAISFVICTFFTSCTSGGEVSENSSQSKEESQVETKIPQYVWDEMDRFSRTYNVEYLLTGSEVEEAEDDKCLAEMEMFLFDHNTNARHNCYVLDKTTGKIYYKSHGYIMSNLYTTEFVAQIKPEDLDKLNKIIEETDLQDWKSFYSGRNEGTGSEAWNVSLVFSDGTVEHHGGYGMTRGGKPKEFDQLLEYINAEGATIEGRMNEDRKTTTDIEYLSYNYVSFAEVTTLDANEIDRILFFESNQYTRLPEEEDVQTILFLDLLNERLYYEPSELVLKDASKASVQQPLDPKLTAQVLENMEKNQVLSWKEYNSGDSRGIGGIPAWSVGIQYKDGTIARYYGDGVGAGATPQSTALFEYIHSVEDSLT